jgi:filamentous hemagglutinin family protein
MKIINEVQGSQGWLDARKGCDTASELSAAAGVSKYTSRSDLLKQKATGIISDVDSNTQALFNKGHAAEESARMIAEKIIGEDLSPITGMIEVDGLKLLASLDGITFDGEILFEHKLWSESLAEQVRTGILHAHYALQLDQQMLVSSAKKVLFMTSDGTEERMAWMWYTPELEEFGHVVDIWRQFHKDLENYQHVEVLPAAVAAPTKDLPALSIQVNGSISLISNLDKFGKELNAFVGQINKEPTDDQGFADAEAAIKTLQNAQDALEAAESNALAQTSDIDDMRKTVKLYADTARTTRLMLEKMVKARKESLRLEIMQGGKDKLAEHIATLNKRLGKPYMPAIAADFALAVKNKRTIASLRESVNNELLRCTLEASTIADKIEINLNSLRELAKDHFFLFSDTQQIVMKGNDDLVALIKVRISDHEKEVAEKFEAERTKMQAEEEAKARAKVDEEKRVAEMVLAASKLPEIPKERVGEIIRSLSQTGLSATKTEADNGGAVVTQIPAKELCRPTRIQMIEAVAKEFNMNYSAAEQCLRDTFANVGA